MQVLLAIMLTLWSCSGGKQDEQKSTQDAGRDESEQMFNTERNEKKTEADRDIKHDTVAKVVKGDRNDNNSEASKELKN